MAERHRRRVRVLVAARHEPTRAGIAVALARAGHEVVAEAPDTVSALALATALRPDVCLVDLELAGGGIALVRAMAGRSPATRAVVLAPALRHAELLAALRAGAVGYVVEGMDASRLAGEVEAAAAGQAALSRELTMHLIDAFRTAADPARPAGTEALTARELQVLQLLAADRTTKQIARELGLSATTVRRHISTAVAKLGVAGRREAAGVLRDVQEGERP